MALANGVTSVFVNNIPQKVHWRWLWRIFSNHAKVADVFIPKKRSRNGSRYGFVRFVSRFDAYKVVKRLNGTWLLNSRLAVNIARFKGRSEYWRKVTPTTKSNSSPNQEAVVQPGFQDESKDRVVSRDEKEEGFQKKSYRQFFMLFLFAVAFSFDHESSDNCCLAGVFNAIGSVSERRGCVQTDGRYRAKSFLLSLLVA
ncbi:hypothetical protein REPUB_Repub03eG0234200 [Reevesia pubescens]